MNAPTRILVVLGGIFVVLALGIVAMFAFGTPVAPQVSAQSEPEGVTSPPVSEVATVAPTGPLAIEIPGCVCHSDDPVVVAEHATYRMSQCFDCHKDGGPSMGGR